MLQYLFDHISEYAHPGSAAKEDMERCFSERVIQKNEILLTSGQVCRHLYFLAQGSLRGYYLLDGKEITHWFAFEKDFVTSFHSFITQQPAVENIQALEGTILWMISKSDLDDLLNRHREIEKIVRLAYEKYYIRLEERFVNGHFKSGKERYETLVKFTPHILERVPLGYIASYLGITQETLSRIRASFNK